VLVPGQRRKQIADDPARASLDLDRHRHAGTKLDELVLYLHVRTVERNSRGIFQLLTSRLTAALRCARRSIIRRALLPVASDGVR